MKGSITRMGAVLCAILVASSSSIWREATEAFDAAEFEKAVPLLRAVLYPPQLPANDMKRARLLLTQALFFSGLKDDAKREARSLLKQAPTIKVDLTNAAPDFVQFFNALRDKEKPAPPPTVVHRAAPELELKVSNPRQTEPPLATAPPAPTPASAPMVVTHDQAVTPVRSAGAPWYLKMLPLGVGQFANHDLVGGGVFLSAEVVLIGSNVILSVYNAGQRRAGAYPHTSAYPALYVLQVVSAAAAYGTLVVGLIDAFVWSPARGTAHLSMALAPLDCGMSATISGVF